MKSGKKSLILRFLPYYKPYLGVFAADLLCATVVSAVALIFPMLVRSILNNGISETGVDLKYVFIVGGIVLLLKVIEALCSYFVEYKGHMMGVLMETDMRNALYDHLQKLPYSYYDNTKIGHIMSRITTDLFDITEFAHHCPEELYKAAIKIIGGFILLSTICFELTVIIFALLPLMVIYAMYYNRKMHAAFKLRRKQIGEINANVEDSLSGIRVVKSFANEDLERKKFAATSGEFSRVKSISYKYMGLFHSGIGFFDGLMYIAVVVGGAVFIATGVIEATDLVAFLLYVSTLLTSIRTIIQFTETFQNGMTGFARYVEILDTPVDIQDAPDATELTDVKGEVTFDNVSFRYSEESADVLSHLNLKVEAGMNVAIVGPSGGGKTTLCSLIPRFYEVNSGRIMIDGKDIRTVTQQSLRENIGIVQQDVYLFSGSIRENIAYGMPDATDEEIVTAAKNAGAHDFITELDDGYDTYVGERGVKLSGGQKQRISIARVFLKNPPVLILDEATSALDNESERLVQRSLDRLAKDRTTFIIAHRLSTVKNAQVIIVLTENGIEEFGDHNSLMEKKGVYYHLYEVYSDAFTG